MLDIKLKLRPGHTSFREWMAPSSLKTLFWNVTYACNFRCPICFTDSGAARDDELTTAEALELARKAHQAGAKDILISGGEPFLRKDLLLVLSRLAEYGITARIASNGSLLGDKILSRLRSETLAKSFQVSLDSTNPDVYARIHGTEPSMLETVLDNLKRIRDSGFHTTVSARLTPLTLPGIPGLLDLAVREEWATVTIHYPLHTGRIGDAFPHDKDILVLLEPVFDYFCLLPQHWLVETYIPWAEYHPVIRRLEKRVTVVHRGCRAGRDRLTVSPAGHLSPCVCLDIPPAYIGNVKNGDLADVFLSSPLARLFRQPEGHGICTDCTHLSHCGGGCRAAALALTGRIDAHDESCPVRRRRMAKGE
jgi:radical SAM protein with 4Fe4S-binding SPASM domain